MLLALVNVHDCRVSCEGLISYVTVSNYNGQKHINKKWRENKIITLKYFNLEHQLFFSIVFYQTAIYYNIKLTFSSSFSYRNKKKKQIFCNNKFLEQEMEWNK